MIIHPPKRSGTKLLSPGKRPCATLRLPPRMPVNLDGETLAKIADILDAKSDLDALSYVLKNPQLNFRIISIDSEHVQSDTLKLTEIGVTVLDVATLQPHQDGSRQTTIESFVEHMYPMNFLICENGHLFNNVVIESDPQGFRFGWSRWIARNEVSTVLTELINKTDHPDAPEVCPVVLLSHDADKLHDLLVDAEIDISNISHVVRTLHTEEMAKSPQHYPWRGSRDIDLTSLILENDMKPLGKEKPMGEDYLHNSGNNAALTMLCAASMIDDCKDRFGSDLTRTEERELNHGLVDSLILSTFNNKAMTKIGHDVYCIRCNAAGDHFEHECIPEQNPVSCEHCKKRGERPETIGNHDTHRCLRLYQDISPFEEDDCDDR